MGAPSTGSVVMSVSRGGAFPQVGGFSCSGDTCSEGQRGGPETAEKEKQNGNFSWSLGTEFFAYFLFNTASSLVRLFTRVRSVLSEDLSSST